MLPLNADNTEIKYLIHYNLNPDLLDCLYEIISYMEYLNKDIFTELEYSTKTKYKILENKQEEIQELIKSGYIIQEGKGKKYKVITHPWN